ncbi:MAG: Asp-tRNA(Asn)/Glu-tRNA(Gln) amidotransferase subunit GatC [Luminiphilus sp.]|jgi:aspartyl-tRNA(Asn)/glutamyl-tRNA(Gln) amidotransferase subunit C|nr:Asp-tRNA(Asn)/Glu-tRNA(Gln) amidotransferase subunit GatC [Luminiphilus sp.]
MPVSPEDIKNVALLARLSISTSDLAEVTERFGRVLQLVDELNTIDTSEVMPMSNPHDMEQRLRQDAVTETNNREALMASAPAQEQGYFLVPKVID